MCKFRIGRRAATRYDLNDRQLWAESANRPLLPGLQPGWLIGLSRDPGCPSKPLGLVVVLVGRH
jgi:hypothetical protein